MRPIITGLALTAAAMLALASPRLADACAGLIGSNGAVNLGRTTTLAAYHEGVEHYVTSFEFQGGGGEFGTLIPLPGVPTDVERGGAWTLQRLVRETDPPPPEAEFAADGAVRAASAEVLQEVRIDALDITILKGGGPDVAQWAQDHGFRLSPDAPEVLDFYAKRSPIFLAAVFDGDAAAERGQLVGDGTPVHLTIPTTNPWVPLRILGLGKQQFERVEADVYLLTDDKPALLHGDIFGIELGHSARATDLLLDDLRADDGMGWVPDQAWLSKIEIDAYAGDIDFDLAVDASGQDQPSRLAAGLGLVPAPEIGTAGSDGSTTLVIGIIAALVAIIGAAFVATRQPSGLRTS